MLKIQKTRGWLFLQETKKHKNDNEFLETKKEKNQPVPWGKRNWVQLGVFLVTIGIGVQFFIYVHQSSGDGIVTVPRPPGVEGFLPIGALMGWKLYLQTGIWDHVHPAAMVIFGFACLLSIALRKSFCGWFCPAGTLSEWLWKFGGRFFGKNYQLPAWMDFPLRALKYLLLGFFIWAVFSMESLSILSFLQSPYYKISDVKMLHFFTRMSTLTMVVLILLGLASIIIRNFWCRYLCPYGALLGLLAIFSPTRIQRSPENCISCRRCSQICPYHLPVDEKLGIISPECNGCMDCTAVCPADNALELKTKGTGKYVWNTAKVSIVIIGLFAGLVFTARMTGHWQSSVTAQEFRIRLQTIDSPGVSHPAVRFR